jgi:hypothetical protein
MADQCHFVQPHLTPPIFERIHKKGFSFLNSARDIVLLGFDYEWHAG